MKLIIPILSWASATAAILSLPVQPTGVVLLARENEFCLPSCASIFSVCHKSPSGFSACARTLCSGNKSCGSCDICQETTKETTEKSALDARGIHPDNWCPNWCGLVYKVCTGPDPTDIKDLATCIQVGACHDISCTPCKLCGGTHNPANWKNWPELPPSTHANGDAVYGEMGKRGEDLESREESTEGGEERICRRKCKKDHSDCNSVHCRRSPWCENSSESQDETSAVEATVETTQVDDAVVDTDATLCLACNIHDPQDCKLNRCARCPHCKKQKPPQPRDEDSVAVETPQSNNAAVNEKTPTCQLKCHDSKRYCVRSICSTCPWCNKYPPHRSEE